MSRKPKRQVLTIKVDAVDIQVLLPQPAYARRGVGVHNLAVDAEPTKVLEIWTVKPG